MCHMTGCLGGFDVGVGSVHSKISHASVVALVSYVPGAGSCGNHRGWICPRRQGAVEVGRFPWLTASGWGGTGGAGVSCWGG